MHKQAALVLPGAVQMRIKNSQSSSGERLSQTKSMVLPEPETLQKPVSSINRHRRNQSQHNMDASVGLQPVLKEYLNKAKIAEGGKKLRKNWTSSWVVLSSSQLLFYKESKQEAVANLKPSCRPDGVDLCGAAIEWTTEKSSRKNVMQVRQLILEYFNHCIDILTDKYCLVNLNGEAIETDLLVVLKPSHEVSPLITWPIASAPIIYPFFCNSNL
ncbi:rho GTPase-activating protein 15-like [Triplophysa rosa]|uniref:rho GTPase-activating protein 15-like n=1 Tax=Triplophysa rosa TaxID=992332 RepID=UPI00254616FE|nr:rho GTPase-activating protein 15-like [Triplophysa rosa]